MDHVRLGSVALAILLPGSPLRVTGPPTDTACCRPEQGRTLGVRAPFQVNAPFHTENSESHEEFPVEG